MAVGCVFFYRAWKPGENLWSSGLNTWSRAREIGLFQVFCFYCVSEPEWQTEVNKNLNYEPNDKKGHSYANENRKV
jgi:hypothetical protein